MRMNSDEIGNFIKRIKDSLDSIAKKLVASNAGTKQWTCECLYALASLGVDDGYGVCPHPSNMRGAWLYDLIWYKEEKNDTIWPKRITDVVLALESEWSPYLGEIRYDFQKLIQAKAQLKMLICGDIGESGIKALEDDIEAFEPKDSSETYLFAVYNSGKRMFEYKTVCV